MGKGGKQKVGICWGRSLYFCCKWVFERKAVFTAWHSGIWRCCSQLLQPWHLQLEEKPSQMMSVKHPALTADGGALSKTQCRPSNELSFWCLAPPMPFLGHGGPRQRGWSSPIAPREPRGVWGSACSSWVRAFKVTAHNSATEKSMGSAASSE